MIVLAFGIAFGAFFNRRPVIAPENNVVTPSVSPTISNSNTGSIGGYLIYPSSGIPDEVGVCAQNIDNPLLLTCVKQIKDPKYKNGVGFQMNLDPGNYYVYSVYQDLKAYYDEYVICGLKAECTSHTKIPVVVTAGSVQDNILPHDWYDQSPTSSPKPSVSPTAKPTIKPLVTININPQVFKLIPSNTPTPTPIPTLIKIKINSNLKLIQP